VSELGDSSVNLVCRPWVKPTDYWAVYFDVVEKGKKALEEAGITIPFPQRDVHLYNEK
jgi:small conductance mechanosensitive channel